jgi:hypothetical protein
MPKVDLEVVGKDKASGKIKGITGSIIGAQLAVDALKKGFSLLSGVVKQSIDAFIEQQRVETQLNAVLESTNHAAGLTATEIKNMAAGLQQVTTFGDEAIISGQNMLLTFTKIGKDVFPQATEIMLDMSEAMGQDMKSSAVQLGKALNDPVLGVSALSRVGIQFTESQKEMIKTLVDTGDVAGAQAIIMKELETQFGGSARAARDTLGGSLKSLNNTWGDLLETIGGVAAPILREISEDLIGLVTNVNDFVKSSNLIPMVAGSFEVLKQVVGGIAGAIGELGSMIGGNIRDNLLELGEKSGFAAHKFDILAAISQGVQSVLKIVGTVINALITNFFNFINIIIEAIKVFGSFKDAITGKQKWSDAFNSIKNVGDAAKKYIVEGIGGTKDVFDSVFEEFKAFGVNVQIESDKYTTAFQDGYNSIISTVDNNPIEPKMIAPDMDSVVRDIRTQIEEVAVPEIKAQLEIDVSAIVSNIAGAIGGAFGGASGDFGLNFSGLEEDLANSEKQYNDRIEALKEQAENASDVEKERIKEQIKALEKQKEKEMESIQNEIDKLKELSEQRAEAGGLLGEITSGISAVVQGFASGGIVGGIIAAITVFMNLIKDGLAPTIDELAPFLDVLLEQFVTLGMQVGRILAPHMKILVTILIVVNTLLEVFLPLLIALQFPLEVLAGLLIHIVNPLREVNKQLQAFAQWINDTIGAVNDALGGGGGGGGGNWWDNPFGFQHGGEFTVPAGYPNDSFKPNIALTSGERVTVTPAGQSSRGEMTMIFNIGEIRDRETADYFAGQVMQLYEQEASR